MPRVKNNIRVHVKHFLANKRALCSAVTAGALCIVILLLHRYETILTEDELIAVFENNKDRVNRLVGMFLDDCGEVEKIGDGRAFPSNSINQERLKEYLGLMKKSMIVEVSASSDNEYIWMKVDTAGIVKMKEIGYVYTKTIPRPLVNFIDKSDVEFFDDIIYRKIDNYYYLYAEHTNLFYVLSHL